MDSPIIPAVYLAFHERAALGIILLTLLGLTSALILIAYLVPDASSSQNAPAGCRQLGSASASNFQRNLKFKRTSPSWVVEALTIYPIKSCGPVVLPKADVVPTGLAYDRQFSFAQLVSSLPAPQEDGSYKVDHQWQFATLRHFPRLARVNVELWVPDKRAKGYKSSEWVKSKGCIVVRFPFTPIVSFSIDGLKAIWAGFQAIVKERRISAEPEVSFYLPFDPCAERIEKMGYSREKMKIWKEAPEALNISSEISPETLAKLKYFLGVRNPLTLFRVDTQKYRSVFRCAPRQDVTRYQPIIGFQDAYALHMLNIASLEDLESRISRRVIKHLDPLRFRFNILISGPPAFAEDDWAVVRIGSCTYHVSCRTARCKLPNVDPATGIADKDEPHLAMAKYRRIDEGAGLNPCLGMQLTPILTDDTVDAASNCKIGEIRVGDSVELLRTGEHFYIKQ
ncbi:MOSC domain-containing protein [Lineolata rhizophorae]|uniref:MOSC domain-containing protein n=1 Tax=Lineolata rhizophorae TaxID=578093 RepID=A0A6A6NTJ0_9PEZI|nr:MOSC domain-containing protein [Lineolata rhizophorae]